MRREYHRPLAGERKSSGVAALLPGLAALRHYRIGFLRVDALAGITVAAYMIPQVMAYAQIAGLPPSTGLLAMIGPTLAYFVFGTSRRLSVGPESTTALMTATAIGAVGVSDPSKYAALAAAFAVVTGGLCVLAWMGRLGFLADLLSKPVLVGYMWGIAVLMVVSQIPKITLIRTSGDTLIAEVISAWRHRADLHWPTLALASGLLVLLLIGARLAPKLPNPLFAVLLGTGLVWLLEWQRHGIETIGALPRTWAGFGLPAMSWSQFVAMLVPALGIAVVAYSDNVLTARAFVDPGERIDDNQEFLALGAANIAGGVLGGFPVSSSGSRTAIGATLGNKTQVFSLIALAVMGLVVVFGGDVLAAFPSAALGALVVYAAIRLVEVGELRRLAQFRLSEFVLCLLTVVCVIVFGALNGILVAVALSLGDLLRRVARPHDAVLGFVPDLAGMHDIEDFPEAVQEPGLLAYRYDSPLFFANADDLHSRAVRAVDDAPGTTQWFLMNMEANVEVDLTSTDGLRELIKELQGRGIIVALARVKQELHDDLEVSGLVDLIGPERIYPTMPTAVAAFREWRDSADP